MYVFIVIFLMLEMVLLMIITASVITITAVDRFIG